MPGGKLGLIAARQLAPAVDNLLTDAFERAQRRRRDGIDANEQVISCFGFDEGRFGAAFRRERGLYDFTRIVEIAQRRTAAHA